MKCPSCHSKLIEGKLVDKKSEIEYCTFKCPKCSYMKGIPKGVKK